MIGKMGERAMWAKVRCVGKSALCVRERKRESESESVRERKTDLIPNRGGRGVAEAVERNA